MKHSIIAVCDKSEAVAQADFVEEINTHIENGVWELAGSHCHTIETYTSEHGTTDQYHHYSVLIRHT